MKKANKAGKSVDKKLIVRVNKIVDLFEKEKGQLRFKKPNDPLTGLVNTILSQNTNDNNRDKAYANLMQTYPTWEEMHHAPVNELAEVIRVAGLNKQKSVRIQALLEYLKKTQGEYTADLLKEMTFDEAVEALGHLKGIGLKTLAVVMCFFIGVDIFPVDTHVHRLSRRFGFVPDKFDAVKTFNTMRYLVPESKSFQFHLHLIRHGREVCHARKPDCSGCFVSHECPFYVNE